MLDEINLDKAFIQDIIKNYKVLYPKSVLFTPEDEIKKILRVAFYTLNIKFKG